ncbi:hypothetical protein [Polymorphospora sp. NPDC050346]|uniref:hypothetical protein n=1 Tax=Polymorphospora sp. NPDC050346 TaxID=3155780 RepID=UPI0033F5BF7B
MDAAVVLLSHPLMAPFSPVGIDPHGPGVDWEVDGATLAALGVVRVHSAKRVKAGSNQYWWPLAPAPIGQRRSLDPAAAAERAGG